MTGKIKRFTVQGHAPFPLDMLRYDHCWPSESADVAAIHDNLEVELQPPPQAPVKITLSSFYPATPARWESMGWRVVDQRK